MIRFGVAGWDYKDWWGPVYPTTKPRGFDPLAYLTRYFDTIEINSTFYRPAAPASARSWARRVVQNQNFRFTAKLWHRFTHERDTAWSPNEVTAVREGLDPLAESGRLGCVLIQFPWSFKRTADSREWLDDVIGAFSAYPLVVEVRHGSWNVPEFYAALAERQVGVVNIDQPVFRNSIKPDAQVTAETGYVRLHGRNYEHWFAEDAAPHERYDYLYSAEELTPWLDRIHEVAQRARDTYVITNNHYRGQEAVNAAMLRKLYFGGDVEVPPELEEAYWSVLAPLGIRGAVPTEPRLPL
ncbi:MAG TPA: DUF72 domain-containing protein [Gemmatimonadales bacterium]